MAGPGNARGGLGWVILAIALAVPGVLFYNWWSHLKGEREKSVAAKARNRVAEGGVFLSSPNARLINPMAPTVSTTSSSLPIEASTETSHVVDHPGQIAPPISPLPESVVVVASSAGFQQAAFSTAAADAPSLKRDPTLSPYDLVRIRENEESRLRSARELADMNRPKKEKRVKVVDPKNLVDLQGIISNPDSGFKAIVNNEVFSPGEFVGNTKIRILKINDSSVTFDYHGKKFSKGVSRN